jgi:acetylornithine/succinyldiaminopimelate/putrescine aminotransferase
MTAELHAFFDTRPFVHVSTYGGAELGCAAALAVLDITEAPGFLERVRAVSDRLAEAFAPLPFEVRRRGLMMGFRFGGPEHGPMAARAAYEAGILCAFANNDPSVLQFLPPLVLTDAQLEDLIGRVGRAFR